MARQELTKTIINRVAGELGLGKDVDPYSTQNAAFEQMTALLNSAGQELVELGDWQVLRKKHSFTTTTATEYDLPTDFGYMINQTHWDETADLPLGGPISGQAWAYLEGSGTNSTIYVQFKQEDNKIVLWPSPQTAGKTISFYYISRCWATSAGGDALDWTTASDDTVLLEPILVQKFLKVKYLEAKNLPSQAARQELVMMYNSRNGKDKGAQVLNAGSGGHETTLLGTANIPVQGWG
jgi:hypothetical protein